MANEGFTSTFSEFILYTGNLGEKVQYSSHIKVMTKTLSLLSEYSMYS